MDVQEVDKKCVHLSHCRNGAFLFRFRCFRLLYFCMGRTEPRARDCQMERATALLISGTTLIGSTALDGRTTSESTLHNDEKVNPLRHSPYD